MKTIGIIGGGNMGEAILARVRHQYMVHICEANAARQAYLRRTYKIVSQKMTDIIAVSDAVIIAVKPQDINDILSALRHCPLKGKVLISIAAGITTGYIEKMIGVEVKVIRTMPNMPALIGEGMTGICAGRYATVQNMKAAVKLFTCIGNTIIVEEKLMDAITAVSGSGPAYVFLFVECLIKAAQNLGLTPQQSKDLVYQTLLGSAHLLEKADDDAAMLRVKVTSKGGTTQAAMDVFMTYRIDKIFTEALAAAQHRAKELAK